MLVIRGLHLASFSFLYIELRVKQPSSYLNMNIYKHFSYPAWIQALTRNGGLQIALRSRRSRAVRLVVRPGLALRAGVAELGAILRGGTWLEKNRHVWKVSVESINTIVAVLPVCATYNDASGQQKHQPLHVFLRICLSFTDKLSSSFLT